MIKDFSPIYYYYYVDNKWGTWQGNGKGTDVKLVEVWEGRKITIHPSRNTFFWVTDPKQKDIWHEKATGPMMDIMLNLRQGLLPPPAALNDLGILRGVRLPAPSKDYGKSKDIPQWATVDNLIGYTSESKITWIFDPVIGNHVANIQNLAFDALPSVYFKQGHLTSDHPEQGNIGWTPTKGKLPEKCLFFGNVLKQYV